MTEESLFVLALEKPSGAERQAFLDAACGGDAALRVRVEQLLAADQQSRGILEHGPPIAARVGIPTDPLGADRIFAGRFKLRQKLGEGGMGEVWVADQTEPVQRRVALKVVRAGFDSRRWLVRFEQERQALALMDHPNIARVLDAGVADGRPYIVMELIKGVPITEYCDAARLSPRQRLELFIPVCQAVQHAHQKGIIHRDLKPSNILVGLYDGRPVPKVIDFGVAKATGPRLTEESIYTEVGALIGTLEYMSPEQAELNNLDIDTRSDIYALGAVLYELLTGSVPLSRRELQAAAFTETLRMIKEVEPPRPSTRLSGSGTLPSIAAVRQTEPKKLLTLLRGELDWIVMKCLEKDRGRRYESAGGVAADVQRYLADEPVLAGPPSSWYRFRKFARRNRPHLALAAALALLLSGAAAFVWHADRQATQRRADAEKRDREESDRRNRNAEAVAGLLDQCEAALRADQADQAALKLQAAEWRAADGGAENLATRLSQCRADLVLLRELDEVDKFRWTPAEGRLPGFAAQAARWRAALVASGMTPDAIPVAEAARRVTGSPIRDRLLAVLDAWQGCEPSAWVRAVLRAADPDPYRDAFRDALAAGDRSGAAALLGRPDALAQPARFVAALPPLDEVPLDRRMALLQRALRARPGNLALLMALGNNISRTRPELVADRVRWFQAAVAAHPESAVAHNNLALALRDKGDRDGACAEVREALRVDPNYSPARVNLGLILRNQGDLDGALAELLEAIRLDPKLAAAHSNLGLLLQQKGDVHGALAAYREAIRVDQTYAIAHNNLAWLLAVGPDGVRDAREAVAHAVRACELSDWARPECLDTLAAAYASAGDFDRAVKYEQMALASPAFEKADGQGGRDRLQFYLQKKPYRASAWVRREVAPLPREARP